MAPSVDIKSINDRPRPGHSAPSRSSASVMNQATTKAGGDRSLKRARLDDENDFTRAFSKLGITGVPSNSSSEYVEFLLSSISSTPEHRIVMDKWIDEKYRTDNDNSQGNESSLKTTDDESSLKTIVNGPSLKTIGFENQLVVNKNFCIKHKKSDLNDLVFMKADSRDGLLRLLCVDTQEFEEKKEESHNRMKIVMNSPNGSADNLVDKYEPLANVDKINALRLEQKIATGIVDHRLVRAQARVEKNRARVEESIQGLDMSQDEVKQIKKLQTVVGEKGRFIDELAKEEKSHQQHFDSIKQIIDSRISQKRATEAWENVLESDPRLKEQCILKAPRSVQMNHLNNNETHYFAKHADQRSVDDFSVNPSESYGEKDESKPPMSQVKSRNEDNTGDDEYNFGDDDDDKEYPPT